MRRLLTWLLVVCILVLSCACGKQTTPPPAALVGEEQPQQSGWYVQEHTAITKEAIQAVVSQEYQKPRNVIVMIGDGMGPNDLILTEQYSAYCQEYGLIMNQLSHHGMAITASADNAVTDSAASATALATGYKTKNGMIGVWADRSEHKNISEIAREQGKKVGIVTNDSVLGATPSAFTVHAYSRQATKLLANGFIEFMPDVLIGQNQMTFTDALTAENQTRMTETALVASSIPEMAELLDGDRGGDKPLIGFYSSDLFGNPNDDLAYVTDIALNRLKNDNGFFLMVESAGTDKAGHGNRIDAKMNSVITFERAIAVVLHFMKDNPDTLLIITSDHETGGVQLPASGEQPSNDLFTTEDHTAADVRVFALGAGSAYFKDKTVDNTDIAKFAIAAVSE